MKITQIKLSAIEEDQDQPRYKFDEDALLELMDSIRELGLLSPIKVRKIGDNRFRIIYGNRRYKACQKLGFEEIPCIVTDLSDEKEIYLEQVAENLSREDFNPVEEAEAFDKLLHDPKFASSIKFLSSKLGKTETYIRNKCELLKFGPAVRALVVRGTQIRKDQLTEDQLMALKGLPTEYLDSLAMTIARDEMPVSDVRKIAKLFKDKDISASVKSKLLYKSGPGLLETWSVYQQNKKENAKAEKMKKEEEQAKRNKEVEPSDREKLAMESARTSMELIEGNVKKWLDMMATPMPAANLEGVEDQADLMHQVDTLIQEMEQRLEAWKALQAALSEQTHSHNTKGGRT